METEHSSLALTGIIIALIFVTIIFLLKTQKNSIRSVNKFNVNAIDFAGPAGQTDGNDKTIND